jgi:hypothetical protein
MKLQLKLDQKAIQQFFIDHVDKMVLAGFVVCFLAVAYNALNRKGFEVTGHTRQDSQPKNLEDVVAAAKDKISQPYKPKTAYENLVDEFKYEKQIVESRGRVDPRQYAFVTQLTMPIVPTAILRGAPKVLPVERLVAIAGRGPVVAGGQGIGGGADTGVHGQRWILVKGLVPIAKQIEEYERCFANATNRTQQDSPTYVGFLVERTDVTQAGAEQPVKFFTASAKGAAGEPGAAAQAGEEIVDRRFTDPAVTRPLPQVADWSWGSEAAYAPEIPMLDKAVVGGGPVPVGTQPPPRIPGGRQPHGGAGILPHGGSLAVGGSAGYSPRGSAGYPPRPAPVRPPPKVPGGEEPGGDPFDPKANPPAAAVAANPQLAPDKEPDYWLFRFFDYSVQPGKQYRYRVFLLLENPNYGLSESVLQVPNSNKAAMIGYDKVERDSSQPSKPIIGVKHDPALADWSGPSSAVTMPEDVAVLASAVQVPSKAGQEPSGTVCVVSWSKNLGRNAWHEYPVVRGKMADFKADTLIDGQHVNVPFITHALVVDLAGDKIAPAAHDLPAGDSQMLILESGRLVIHDKDVDGERFKQLVPPKRDVKVEDKVKRDVRGKQKRDTEEVPDDDGTRDIFGKGKKSNGKRM